MDWILRIGAAVIAVALAYVVTRPPDNSWSWNATTISHLKQVTLALTMYEKDYPGGLPDFTTTTGFAHFSPPT